MVIDLAFKSLKIYVAGKQEICSSEQLSLKMFVEKSKGRIYEKVTDVEMLDHIVRDP